MFPMKKLILSLYNKAECGYWWDSLFKIWHSKSQSNGFFCTPITLFYIAQAYIVSISGLIKSNWNLKIFRLSRLYLPVHLFLSHMSGVVLLSQANLESLCQLFSTTFILCVCHTRMEKKGKINKAVGSWNGADWEIFM